ncbi:MAG: hypothetical protein ACKPJD_16780, partial [Planctomycetaceae bacterium]
MKQVVEFGRWSAGYRAALFVLLAGIAVLWPGAGFVPVVLGQDEPKADAAAAPADEAAEATADAAAPAAADG